MRIRDRDTCHAGSLRRSNPVACVFDRYGLDWLDAEPLQCDLVDIRRRLCVDTSSPPTIKSNLFVASTWPR